MSTAQLELQARPETEAPFGGEGELERAADAWIHSPHGRHITKMAYVEIARLLRRCQPGQRISMDHVVHILRFRLKAIKCYLKQRGIPFANSGGYALNDHHTAYLSRHVAKHRPDWADRFERRKVNKKKIVERVTIVKERIAA